MFPFLFQQGPFWVYFTVTPRFIGASFICKQLKPTGSSSSRHLSWKDAGASGRWQSGGRARPRGTTWHPNQEPANCRDSAPSSQCVPGTTASCRHCLWRSPTSLSLRMDGVCFPSLGPPQSSELWSLLPLVPVSLREGPKVPHTPL